MQKAAFSLISYQFDKVNIDLTKHTSADLLLNFDTHGLYLSDEISFELTFVATVFVQDQAPFASVQCNSTFKFEDVASFDDIPDFFYRNAIAILFPYVRAYLSLVTTQANVPGIILPTLNLSDLAEGLRSNTTQK